MWSCISRIRYQRSAPATSSAEQILVSKQQSKHWLWSLFTAWHRSAGWTRLGVHLACAKEAQRTSSNVIFLPMRCGVDLTVLLCCCLDAKQPTSHSHHHNCCDALPSTHSATCIHQTGRDSTMLGTKTYSKRQALVRASVCSRMMAGGPAVPLVRRAFCFDHPNR
jgi:hypothetical protein